MVMPLPPNAAPDEDCLHVNVFKSNSDFGSKVPVMVYIHGGGFVMGAASEYYNGQDLLMSKEVLLVTLNYRLGVLGRLFGEQWSKLNNNFGPF